MPVPPQPFRVGYVLECYPKASETFIANEMRAVAACGAEVTAFALRRGEGGLDAGVRAVYPGDAATSDLVGRLTFALGAVRRAGALGRGAPRALASVLRRGKALRFFASRARELGIRHLHAHFSGLPALMALLMAADVDGATVSFAAHARDLYVTPRALDRKARLCRLCVACTAAGAERLRALLRPEDRGKVVHVYHGTDLARFPFRPHPAPSSPSRILAAGRLVPKKGFDVLLRALALLRERREVRCEIVGDGPQRGNLQALAGQLGLERMVSLPGWASYEDMPALYHGADVLAVPSVRAPDGDVDGLPNVAVEALACGTPVVAGAISGIPEAVRQGETGLLVPPGDAAALADALEQALTDEALRTRLAAEGRRLAEEQFDCRTNGRAIYEALLRAAT